MKLGPFAGEVPTATVATRTDCIVAGMLVFALSAVHVPVKVALEGRGAKHDRPLLLPTADANAPDERSWNKWSPGPTPCHADNVT